MHLGGAVFTRRALNARGVHQLSVVDVDTQSEKEAGVPPINELVGAVLRKNEEVIELLRGERG